MLVSTDNKINCFLTIINKLKTILEKDKEKTEVLKSIQEIEKNVLLNKDHYDGEEDRGEWLILQKKKANKNIDSIVSFFPIKPRSSLLKQIQKIKKENSNLSLGEKYYSILSKIQYIFPRPHAIAYTTTAWRTAYYKVNFPQEFYSVLLTYHVTVHDVWLMTLKSEAINFRLENLLSTIDSAKNSEKEIISISKVLKELSKGMNGKDDNENSFLSKKKAEINSTLQNFKNKLIEKILEINSLGGEEKVKNEPLLRIIKHLGQSEEDKIKLKDIVLVNNWNGRLSSDWRLTAKEKELLHTLKIILEMKQKNLNFRLGVDFNLSDAESFQVKDGKIFVPFSAVTGIGTTMAKKIVDYRKEKSSGIKNWKIELNSILNKNHFEQLKQLERFELIIEDLA